MIQTITANYLNQLKSLIQDIDDSQFSKKLTLLSNSSIGMHARHIIEFYICLLNSKSDKLLNYDTRKRDVSIETDSEICVLKINDILNALSENQYDFPLKLYADYSLSKDNQILEIDTTFFRELVYNIEHLIHHLAIIKIGVQALDSNINLHQDFGVAASTIRNRQVCVQ